LNYKEQTHTCISYRDNNMTRDIFYIINFTNRIYKPNIINDIISFYRLILESSIISNFYQEKLTLLLYNTIKNIPILLYSSYINSD